VTRRDQLKLAASRNAQWQRRAAHLQASSQEHQAALEIVPDGGQTERWIESEFTMSGLNNGWRRFKR